MTEARQPGKNEGGHQGLTSNAAVRAPWSPPGHADVLAAIDKARRDLPYNSWPVRDPHCDDLRATTERHIDTGVRYTEPNGGATTTECEHCGDYWPCPDYAQVVHRLAGWGVL